MCISVVFIFVAINIPTSTVLVFMKTNGNKHDCEHETGNLCSNIVIDQYVFINPQLDKTTLQLLPVGLAVKKAITQSERLADCLRKVAAELDTRTLACQLAMDSGKEYIKSLHYEYAKPLFEAAERIVALGQMIGVGIRLDQSLDKPQVSELYYCCYVAIIFL